MRPAIILAALLAAPCAATAAEESVRAEHVVVVYDGIGEAYAKAIARTVEAARGAAVEQFGFDMPETITVQVSRDAGAPVRLFNDGQDRFSLTVHSEDDLRRPAASGVFHIYGLCHEVGHLAMYRPIRERGWMTSAAAEGWAHYLGSRLVDAVYAKEGKDLWPDRYDYLGDGMKRLNAQLAAKDPDATSQGAGLWKEFAGITGDKGAAKAFAAWGSAAVDPADPGPALGKALAAAHYDKRVADWWKKAEPVFLLKRSASPFAASTVDPKKLEGKPAELALDDGDSAGKSSLAGGGHAVRFKVDGPDRYLTGVKIYGSRYGQPAAPREDFHVFLCDADLRVITDFPFPYSSVGYGKPGWTTLPVKPTRLPEEFILCVGFDPTATKGVFVHYDKEASGASLTGLPGRPGREFPRGDWLIRATVDQLKAGK